MICERKSMTNSQVKAIINVILYENLESHFSPGPVTELAEEPLVLKTEKQSEAPINKM